MAQLDVHKLASGPLVVDVQSGVLARLATRVVVPLISRKTLGQPITRLDPVVKVRGTEYVMLVQDLAAVSARLLGPSILSLAVAAVRDPRGAGSAVHGQLRAEPSAGDEARHALTI